MSNGGEGGRGRGPRALSAKQHVPSHGTWAWAWTCYRQQLPLINWRQAGNSNEALLRFLLMAKLAAPMCVGDSHR